MAPETPTQSDEGSKLKQAVLDSQVEGCGTKKSGLPGQHGHVPETQQR